jgi:mannose-1-phosphate guanylyltransferase/phosphomannomutase
MEMKGFILAAGFGTRLKPESDRIPKPLFPIGTSNMIKNAIGYLHANRIEDITVNMHHLADMIKKELSWNVRDSVNLHLIEEEELRGTAGGIKGAEEFLGDSTFVTMNCDILIDLDIRLAVEVHESNNAIATLVVRDNPIPAQIGTLMADKNGRLVRFLDSTSPSYKIEELQPALKMFTGVAIYSPEIFNHIPPGRQVDISTEIFPKLMEADAPLYTYNHTGYWADIGTPTSYSEARMDVALGRFKTHNI